VIDLVSGQTNGVINTLNGTGDEVDGGMGSLRVIGDPDPIGDVCSNASRNQVTMGGKNIGDLLKAPGVTWGSFMGGFNLSIVNSNGTTGCNRSSAGRPARPPTTFRTTAFSLLGLHRESGAYSPSVAGRDRQRRAGEP